MSAECRVKIVEGEHNVLPPSKAELNLIGTNYFVDQRRLSCQVRCYGNITVDLTEQIERSEIQNKKKTLVTKVGFNSYITFNNMFCFAENLILAINNRFVITLLSHVKLPFKTKNLLRKS